MAILLQNTVEDIYHDDDELLYKDMDSKVKAAFQTSQGLIENKENLGDIFNANKDQREFDFKFVIYLAKLKYCLKMLAKFNCEEDILDKIENHHILNNFTANCKTLLELPQCQGKNESIYQFLVKEIIRKYGSPQFKSISSHDELKWIVPKEIFGSDFTVSDKYILMGSDYALVKGALISCLLDNKVLDLETLFKKKAVPFPIIIAALYRNITYSFKTKPDKSTCLIFESCLNKHFPSYKNYWSPMLDNSLSHNLKITEETCKKFDVNALLVQLKFSILMSTSPAIKNLAALINSPGNFKNDYIPAMPQDSIFDTQKAVNDAARGNENPTWYECPNGHTYCLFDCGRPWVVFKCKSCNADIGGTNHVLLPGNKKVTPKDNSVKGYCLPDAAALPEDPIPERTLSAYSFAVLKFVIHSCLYFACDTQEEQVTSIMSFNSMPDKKKFFWDQLTKDLKILGKALNINSEEVITLMHLVCKKIFSNTRPNSNWQSKEDRSRWEDNFQLIIDPIFKNSAMELEKAREAIKNNNKDNDEQSQHIFFMAYELNDDDDSNKACKNVYDNKNFWKYKPRVNLTILNTEIRSQTLSDEFFLLKRFIDKEPHIKLLRNLSTIMRFLNFLQTSFNKDMFKHYAANLSIRQILRKNELPKNFSDKEIEEAILCMERTWYDLKTFIVRKFANDLNLNYIFTLDSKLSFFLPTAAKGDGLICFSLVRYLLGIQNEILDFYKPCQASEAIEIYDAIMFDKEDNIIVYEDIELLKIIKHNYSYDKESKKWFFKFEKISNLICDTFFKNKPKCNLKTIQLFEYADEINDYSLFNKLNEVIPQDCIDSVIQIKIFKEFKDITETSDALNLVKIIINYAKTTSASSDENLKLFIERIYAENNLKTARDALKFNIQDYCQLKHLKNLWIVLMIKKMIFNYRNDQPPFENLHSEFKNVNSVVKVPFANTNPNTVLSLSVVLFQIIEFQLVNASQEMRQTLAETKITDFFEYSLPSLDPIKESDESLKNLSSFISSEIKIKEIHQLWMACTVILDLIH
jgi:hypothetical protein